MELIDTHSHLSFPELMGSLDEVLSRARDAGVKQFITIGTDRKNNRLAIELAAKYDSIYATVGFHPHDAKDVTPAMLEQLHQQSQSDKVVAIGEIGLDYHYDYSQRDIQKDVFRRQLAIAVETALPVVVHSREAFEDTMIILSDFAGKISGVLVHCFGGDAEDVAVCIKRGYYISFTGVVTFKNAHQARDAAAAVPLNRLMVETDCPFMSPAPMRRQKINEPALMLHTAAKLAEIKGIGLEELAEIMTNNTKRFFNI